MKALLSCSILAVALATGAAAQPPKATPGPENKRLGVFAGTWKVDATVQESPMGPAGKMTGTETCRMFEGGFHLTCDSSASGPMGKMKGRAIMSWDPVAKQYHYTGISSMMPTEETATGTISGDTWTWTGKTDLGGGKSMQSRFTIVETSPTVHTMKWEMSEDGKAWKVIMEGKSTKAGT